MLKPLDIKIITLMVTRNLPFSVAYEKVTGSQSSQEMVDQYEKIMESLS